MYLPTSQSIGKAILSCAAAALLFTGTASAQSTSQTESFSIGSSLQCLSASGNFTLPDFDPALGTLESVNLTLSIGNCSKIQVFNTSSNPEAFLNASMSLLGSVTGPNGLLLNASLNSMLASGLALPGTNLFDTGKTDTTTQGSVDPTLLSIWQNQPNGLVDFSYTKGTPTFGGTGSDNLLFGGKVRGYGQVTVEYTYLASGTTDEPPLATPEPAGKYLSGLAAGVMTLMLFGRRRLFNS